MTPSEAVVYLEAILEDTLEAGDERDAKRIEAVQLAISVLKADRPRGRRTKRRNVTIQVSSPREAYGQVRHLARATKEHLVGLYLDAQNGLIVREVLSIGTLNTTRTHPREVLQPAIMNHALGFILVHNHPSGSLVPSRDDVEFTRAMRRAAELMGIDLYDHLVVSREGYVSLKEKGLL